jgi:hypothetical protein
LFFLGVHTLLPGGRIVLPGRGRKVLPGHIISNLFYWDFVLSLLVTTLLPGGGTGLSGVTALLPGGGGGCWGVATLLPGDGSGFLGVTILLPGGSDLSDMIICEFCIK